MMRILAVVALLSIPALTETERDFNQLHGTWRVISWQTNGAFRSDAEISRLAPVYFTGDFYRWEGDPNVGTFRLNATTRPKSVDYTEPHPTAHGSPYSGIYDIDGDHFRDCFRKPGGARPTSFTTRPGDGVSCVEYVRVENTKRGHARGRRAWPRFIAALLLGARRGSGRPIGREDRNLVGGAGAAGSAAG